VVRQVLASTSARIRGARTQATSARELWPGAADLCAAMDSVVRALPQHLHSSRARWSADRNPATRGRFNVPTAWTYNSRGQLVGVALGEDSYSEAFKAAMRWDCCRRLKWIVIAVRFSLARFGR